MTVNPITKAIVATRERCWDLVGIGACTWDTIMTVPGFVLGGGVMKAESMLQQGGGPVATALCQAANLGCRCAMIDRVGSGPVAGMVVNELVRFGVDPRWLQSGPGEPAQAMIQVRRCDGERAIVYHPGNRTSEPDLPDDLDWSQVRALHVNGRHDQLAGQAVARAREAGVLISFDGGSGRWRAGLETYLENADVLVVAEGFAAGATGQHEAHDQLEALRKLAPQALVWGVTCGADGAWLAGGHDAAPFHVPAFKPERVIDTTGAGDIFHGALLAGLLQGRSLEQAARLGAEHAGRNCGYLGGRGAIHERQWS